jgi:L-threonylcarbamoyladenylate synthase
VSDVRVAVEAILAGGLAVIPTDTVYGLACSPVDDDAVQALSTLKRRPPGQPVALVAPSVDVLLELLPELTAPCTAAVRGVLPGPYTLVLPDPANRFPSLAGAAVGTVGARVPALAGPGRQVLEATGALAATSANLHGGRDPRRLEDVPSEVRDVCVIVDGGELPGTPSTVVDLTGPEPRVLREGAVPARDALERLAAALGEEPMP